MQEKDAWTDPQPIAKELPAVKELEPKLIPEPLRNWIIDIAERMSCPIDFVFAATVVGISIVVGARCAVRPKRHDDWEVIPNLWGAVVAQPGELKTPAVEKAIKPLSMLEAAASGGYSEKLKSYECEMTKFQAKKDAIKTALKNRYRNTLEPAKTGEKSRQLATAEELEKKLEELRPPEKPQAVRYKTTNATVEKLHEILTENPRGVLVHNDELVALLSKLDKEDYQQDRAFFLESWNGNNSFTIDRIGRGTLRAETICLAVFGTVQPDVLQKYLEQAVCRFQNDGLMQRLQVMVYPDTKPYELNDSASDKIAMRRVYQIFEKLSSMDFSEHGAGINGKSKMPYFRFSKQAQEFFNRWLVKHEQRRSKRNDHPIVLEHLSKYRSLMPSLALLFHLIRLADQDSQGRISLDSAIKAARLCRYLESHARRIYSLVTKSPANKASASLAEKIRKGMLETGFTQRDVYRKEWRYLTKHEMVAEACERLLEFGWLCEEITEPGQGQKRTIRYTINPKALPKKKRKSGK